jgi:hypothetical protein
MTCEDGSKTGTVKLESNKLEKSRYMSLERWHDRLKQLLCHAPDTIEVSSCL